MNISLKYKSNKKRKKNHTNTDSNEEGAHTYRLAMISTHGYVGAKPPLGAPDTGGQVVYVLELSKVLARLGYIVDIYTRLFEEQVVNENVVEGVNIIRIPSGGDSFIPKEYMIDSMDEWIENAYSFIKSNNKEYLFINSHYWDAGYAGKELSKMLSIPHLHTPHSLGSWKKKKMERDYPESKDSFEEQYNFGKRIQIEKEIYNSADKIIATTPIQKEIIEVDYNLPRTKIDMIPPGYDDNKFYPMADASKTMLKEKFNFKDNCILALSRLAHNKGLDLLVESFGLLVKDHFDAQLILAIGHDDRSDEEEIIFQNILGIVEKYEIEDKIHFIGFIPDEELADIYRASDLFVLSSRYEPFGMTAVEAMACGTPTLVTKHGGLCEILEDGKHAIVTDPFDPAAMASDMAAVLKHQGIALHLCAEGSRIAREQFSWTEIASRLVADVKSEIL